MYLLGARMLEVYPHVPLVDHLGLGVALLSYNGRLGWGFNADYDLVPDLDAFVEATRASFAELRGIAAGLAAPPAPAPGAPADSRPRAPRARRPRRAPAPSGGAG
jgi:hypothetical protein